MNEAQSDVLHKVADLLGEHFDHAAVVIGFYDDQKLYNTAGIYHGGVAPAIGLCQLYIEKWSKTHLYGSEEEVDDEF
jgi:hypothetical protein